MTLIAVCAILPSVALALAHDVTPGDAGYIQDIWEGISSPSSISVPNTW